jgi:hypothetical protein
MNEDFVRLNRKELSIILAALNNLSRHDETTLEESTNISISSLYNKIYTIWESLDDKNQVSSST